MEDLVVEPERMGFHQLPDSLGCDDRVLLSGFDQNQGEFFAAVPGKKVLAADYLLHARGEFAQGEISAQVPEPVVHFLEPVDVEQHQ